ncbi:hypothetical protein Ac2012v2_006017 [Leucoagaricus gongylophorus]
MKEKWRKKGKGWGWIGGIGSVRNCADNVMLSSKALCEVHDLNGKVWKKRQQMYQQSEFELDSVLILNGRGKTKMERARISEMRNIAEIEKRKVNRIVR